MSGTQWLDPIGRLHERIYDAETRASLEEIKTRSKRGPAVSQMEWEDIFDRLELAAWFHKAAMKERAEIDPQPPAQQLDFLKEQRRRAVRLARVLEDPRFMNFSFVRGSAFIAVGEAPRMYATLLKELNDFAERLKKQIDDLRRFLTPLRTAKAAGLPVNASAPAATADPAAAGQLGIHPRSAGGFAPPQRCEEPSGEGQQICDCLTAPNPEADKGRGVGKRDVVTDRGSRSEIKAAGEAGVRRSVPKPKPRIPDLKSQFLTDVFAVAQKLFGTSIGTPNGPLIRFVRAAAHPVLKDETPDPVGLRSFGRRLRDSKPKI
jgi:hypothetical protein